MLQAGKLRKCLIGAGGVLGGLRRGHGAGEVLGQFVELGVQALRPQYRVHRKDVGIGAGGKLRAGKARQQRQLAEQLRVGQLV